MRWSVALACGLAQSLAIFPLVPAAPARQQQPLAVPEAEHRHGPNYYVRQQSDVVCRAGASHYAGKIDVSPEKSLFFWFFESRRSPLSDPVIIWLNGGPGGSSMYGLFKEIGGCQLNEFDNDTVYNEHSWANFANVLFIDQPAGVGFSSVNNGTVGGPDNIREASQDFSTFLSIFYSSVFPEYASLPLHIAGESFGGKYVPGFTHYIATTPGLPLPPVESIVLVDAAVDALTAGVAGYYDHFCGVDEHGQRNKPGGFNESTCRAMEEQLPECERLASLCRETYNINICRAAGVWCEEHVGKFLYDEVVPGGRNPYDDRRPCQKPPVCDDFAGSGYSAYLNTSRAKRALGISEAFQFSGINFDLNRRWIASGEVYVPTTREVSFILDETPTRILVLNGDNDSIINTEGQKRAWEHMVWARQALYRISRWVDWQWPDRDGRLTLGGQVKTADKLSFATIIEAGHASPGDQPAAVAYLLECWTSAGGKDGRCPV